MFLALALGIHLVRLLFRAYAWRSILVAAYPEEPPRYRSVFGAYVVGVGVNSIVPARAGDAVKLYLIKHRIRGSSYATLTPTLIAETLFDFFVGLGPIAWGLSPGGRPAHAVYPRLPAGGWGSFVRNQTWAACGLLTRLAGGLRVRIVFPESGPPRARRSGRAARRPEASAGRS